VAAQEKWINQMRESHFQGEWKDSWRHHYPKCHIVKIPDMPKSAAARFIPLKPYDFYAILNGKSYVMELKLETKLGGFPFQDVTEWQVNNLLEAKENGALAYIIINYRTSKLTPRQQKKHGLQSSKLNVVFAIEAETFDLLDKISPSKSIPFDMLMNGDSLLRIYKNGDYWDIPALISKEAEER